MKKYRLGYDYLFPASDSFSYKGDFIGAMAINVLFKISNEDGQEIFFEAEELRDQQLLLNHGDTCYLCDLIICSIDRENIISFEPNIPLLRHCEYNLAWEIDSYIKDLDKGFLDPGLITEAEFIDIMKNNINAFDNSTNRPAQTTAYFTQEVDKKESEKNETF
ncbi:hypothetical protein L1I79_37415 [Strepomyces sp. STD 3.1]|nr:hypothetical protein [Streptomyces sp. STD 3.1]